MPNYWNIYNDRGIKMRTHLLVATLIFIITFTLFQTCVNAFPGSGIVIDKHGQVYITDTSQGVWKINKQGKLTYIPSSLFHWLAIDERGSFAQCQKKFGDCFERITPQIYKPALIMCSDFPLTVNLDGNIYYANTRRTPPEVVRRTPDGSESILAAGDIFQSISGIAAGPNGSLYLTDAGDPYMSVIRKIELDGTITPFPVSLRGSLDSTMSPPETKPAYCRGLAVDLAGNVYVAATGSRNVLKITPKGEKSVILHAANPWSPTGVAVFNSEVYVLEWSDPPPSQIKDNQAWIPRVRKIAKDGTVTILATISR